MNFLEGLALLFIALKLTNFIAWSWCLVLLPLYPLALALILSILGWVIVSNSKAVISVVQRIVN
jgi:hypothetical protein